MATLKDISQQVGVSVSAVSLALRDHPSIGQETRKRIWDVKKKLGYELKSKSNGIIVSGANDGAAHRILTSLGIPLVVCGNYQLGPEPWAWLQAIPSVRLPDLPTRFAQSVITQWAEIRNSKFYAITRPVICYLRVGDLRVLPTSGELAA